MKLLTRSTLFLTIATVLLGSTFSASGARPAPLPYPPPQTSAHLALGNPSNAETDPNNFLVEKRQFALS
jgi:hypothetical protein